MQVSRAKVRVLIATTTGPVEVVRLAEEDATVPCSVVCIAGTTEIAGIGPDYHAFVAPPTGAIQRLFGHERFRLDIARNIDSGTSWQLPVLLAHALYAVDRLAQMGEPAGIVVLATGSVRPIDLAVVPVSHVSSKLGCAREIIEQARKGGTRVLVAFPAASLTDVEPSVLSSLAGQAVETLPVQIVSELLSGLELKTFPDLTREATPAPTHRTRRGTRQLVLEKQGSELAPDFRKTAEEAGLTIRANSDPPGSTATPTLSTLGHSDEGAPQWAAPPSAVKRSSWRNALSLMVAACLGAVLATAALRILATRPSEHVSSITRVPHGPFKPFKDCDDCPEMIPLPAGTFLLGPYEGEPMVFEYELPQRKATINHPFAIGRY